MVVVVEGNNRTKGVVLVERKNRNVVVVVVETKQENGVVVVYNFTIHEAVLKKVESKVDAGSM